MICDKSKDSFPYASGYLFKKAKSGKWQQRWFETNANFLTYYKNEKAEKLLAALNLPHVRSIKLVDNDMYDLENDGALFTIELNTRIYVMKAATREEAASWVNVLVALKSFDLDGKCAANPVSDTCEFDGECAAGSESFWQKGVRCFSFFRCFGLR